MELSPIAGLKHALVAQLAHPIECLNGTKPDCGIETVARTGRAHEPHLGLNGTKPDCGIETAKAFDRYMALADA